MWEHDAGGWYTNVILMPINYMAWDLPDELKKLFYKQVTPPLAIIILSRQGTTDYKPGLTDTFLIPTGLTSLQS